MCWTTCAPTHVGGGSHRACKHTLTQKQFHTPLWSCSRGLAPKQRPAAPVRKCKGQDARGLGRAAPALAPREMGVLHLTALPKHNDKLGCALRATLKIGEARARDITHLARDVPARCSAAPGPAAVGLNFLFTRAAGRAGRGTARMGQGRHGGRECTVRQT